METRIRKLDTASVVKPGPGSSGVWTDTNGDFKWSTLVNGVQVVHTAVNDTDTIDLASATVAGLTIGDDSAFYDTDASTKKFKFDAGSVTGGQTRVITVPDSNMTLAGVALTQTLTNKTLTAPVINTPTVKDLTEVVTATNVIAATETGSVFFLNSATEFVSTLPAPAAGLKFTFVVTAAPSGASYTVVTNSSANIIKGVQFTAEDAAGSGDSGTADDTISFVDGQAVAGDRVDVISDGTSWFAYAFSKVKAGITFTTAS